MLERGGFFRASKDRYFTALVLIAIAAAVVLIDNFTLTWAILGVCFIVGFMEAQKLFNIKSLAMLPIAGAMWIAAYFMTDPEDLIFLILLVYGSYLAFKNKVAISPEEGGKGMKDLIIFIYPTAPMLFMLSLYKDYGMASLFWLIVIVAVTDTAAYFTGKAVGKVPFSPASPNKTLEGVLGGIIVATIVGTLMGLGFLPFFKALLIALAVSVSSIFGDLFESSLKRQAGVKDSGTFLPGHGGILDRLDGHMFGAVAMTVLLRGLY